MVAIEKIIDSLNETLGRWVAWCGVILVTITAMIVVLRYGFQYGSVALQESLLYINTLLVCFGFAYTLKHDGHVRVDVFYRHLGDRQRALLNLAGIVILLVPSMVFVIIYSWDYVALSWQIRERSAESSGLRIVYLLKTVLIVFPALVILQAVAELLKALVVIRPTRRSG